MATIIAIFRGEVIIDETSITFVVNNQTLRLLRRGKMIEKSELTGMTEQLGEQLMQRVNYLEVLLLLDHSIEELGITYAELVRKSEEPDFFDYFDYDNDDYFGLDF